MWIAPSLLDCAALAPLLAVAALVPGFLPKVPSELTPRRGPLSHAAPTES